MGKGIGNTRTDEQYQRIPRQNGRAKLKDSVGLGGRARGLGHRIALGGQPPLVERAEDSRHQREQGQEHRKIKM